MPHRSEKSEQERIARSESPFTPRTKAFGVVGISREAEDRRLGKKIAVNEKAKEENAESDCGVPAPIMAVGCGVGRASTPRSRQPRPSFLGSTDLAPPFVYRFCCCLFHRAAASAPGYSVLADKEPRQLLENFTAMIASGCRAQSGQQGRADNRGRTRDPAATKIAIAVVGISCTEPY